MSDQTLQDELEVDFGTQHLPKEYRCWLFREAALGCDCKMVRGHYALLAKVARQGFDAGRYKPDDVRSVFFYGVVIPRSDALPLGNANSLSELFEGHGLIEVPMGPRLIGISHTGFVHMQRKSVEQVPQLPTPSVELIVEFQRVLVGLELATQVPRWNLFSYAYE